MGDDPDRLRGGLRAVLDGRYKPGRCPALWDGHAAERIAEVVAEIAVSADARIPNDTKTRVHARGLNL